MVVYVCRKCGYRSDRKSSYQAHLRRKTPCRLPGALKPIRCFDCLEEFREKSELKEHCLNSSCRFTDQRSGDRNPAPATVDQLERMIDRIDQISDRVDRQTEILARLADQLERLTPVTPEVLNRQQFNSDQEVNRRHESVNFPFEVFGAQPARPEAAEVFRSVIDQMRHQTT